MTQQNMIIAGVIVGVIVLYLIYSKYESFSLSELNPAKLFESHGLSATQKQNLVNLNNQFPPLSFPNNDLPYNVSNIYMSPGSTNQFTMPKGGKPTLVSLQCGTPSTPMSLPPQTPQAYTTYLNQPLTPIPANS